MSVMYIDEKKLDAQTDGAYDNTPLDKYGGGVIKLHIMELYCNGETNKYYSQGTHYT